MGRIAVHETPLPGLAVVESPLHQDDRGLFQRLYCAGSLAASGVDLPVAQANLSLTRGRGTLRGLHFQLAPFADAKLVRCLKGRVFDVAVDLRAGSPTFLKWHATELSEDRPVALFLPQGFAHGFQVLEDEAQLLYFHSSPWMPTHEGGLRYDDPRLAITWPLPVTQVSERDRRHPIVQPDYPGIHL